MNYVAQHPKPVGIPVTLEDHLCALSFYGRPRVSMTEAGWVCAVEMYVGQVGATFDVRSEFKHATPMDAARQCYSRTMETLKTIQEKISK